MQRSGFRLRKSKVVKIATIVFIALLIVLGAAAGFAWWYDHEGQSADLAFKPIVDHPAFVRQNRVVAIDAAHNNFHTASGRYRPFANLLQADGLTFTSTSAPISQAFLRRIDLLVIANAMGPEGKEDMDPFLIDEKLGLVDWVRGGGRLLLIADHAPFGAAAQDLASRFGVEMHLRYARDDQNHDGWDNERLLFSRANGLLPSNAISDGSSPSERVQKVVAFTGQSLSGPVDCERILPLSSGAYDWESRKVRYSARGHSLALACPFGRGRRGSR